MPVKIGVPDPYKFLFSFWFPKVCRVPPPICRDPPGFLLCFVFLLLSLVGGLDW